MATEILQIDHEEQRVTHLHYLLVPGFGLTDKGLQEPADTLRQLGNAVTVAKKPTAESVYNTLIQTINDGGIDCLVGYSAGAIAAVDALCKAYTIASQYELDNLPKKLALIAPAGLSHGESIVVPFFTQAIKNTIHDRKTRRYNRQQKIPLHILRHIGEHAQLVSRIKKADLDEKIACLKSQGVDICIFGYDRDDIFTTSLLRSAQARNDIKYVPLEGTHSTFPVSPEESIPKLETFARE